MRMVLTTMVFTVLYILLASIVWLSEFFMLEAWAFAAGIILLALIMEKIDRRRPK